MIRIEQQTTATIGAAWAEISNLEAHVEWMKDAVDLRFNTPQRRGVGTLMEVDTKVGPFRTKDHIEIVTWADERSIGIVHRGLVTGTGELAVSPGDGGALITWTENLRFPWWLGGPITGVLAQPVLSRLWTNNLRRLATKLTGP